MNYYDQIAEGYDELHAEEQLKKINHVINLINIGDEKVLDVGCGTALYGNLFSDYTGIDNSKEMLKKSKYNVLYGDAEKLPFSNDSFDCVISITALQNVDNIEKAISEIKRVAKHKIAISILKKSSKISKFRKLLFDFEQFEEDKDIIFYKLIKHSE